MNNLSLYKNERFDIIIQAGQSNAECNGRGGVTGEYVPCERVLQLNSGGFGKIVKDAGGKEALEAVYPNKINITVAAEKTEGDEKIGDFSYAFAQNYLNSGKLQAERKLLIIKAAIGGTGFAKGHWAACGNVRRKMFEMTDAALNLNTNNKIKAFLWAQGEHDAFENSSWTAGQRATAHFSDLKGLTDEVKRRYGDMPFITCGFCSEWERNNHTVCQPVISAKEDICRELGCAAFIDTSDLKSNNEETANGDTIHFGRASVYTLGERFFRAYEKLIR